MSELPDYGRDLIDIHRVIRRLAPTCGVDLNNLNNISALLDNAHLPLHTVQDKSRVTLRGLMFLRLKVWKEMRA
jgi:hypothetical protein